MQKKRLVLGIVLLVILAIVAIFLFFNYQEYESLGLAEQQDVSENSEFQNDYSKLKELTNSDTGEAIIVIGSQSVFSFEEVYHSYLYSYPVDGVNIKINYFDAIKGIEKLNLKFNSNLFNISARESENEYRMYNESNENIFIKINSSCSKPYLFNEFLGIMQKDCIFELSDSTEGEYKSYLSESSLDIALIYKKDPAFKSFYSEFYIPLVNNSSNKNFSNIGFFDFLINKDKIKKKMGETVFLTAYLFSFIPELHDYSTELMQIGQNNYYFFGGEQSIDEINNKCDLIVEKLNLSPSWELVRMDDFFVGGVVSVYESVKDNLVEKYSSSKGKLRTYYCFALIRLDNIYGNNSDLVNWKKDKATYDLINLLNYSKDKNIEFILDGQSLKIASGESEIDLILVKNKSGIDISVENFIVETGLQDYIEIAQTSNYLKIKNSRESSTTFKYELSKTFNGSDYEYSILIKRA